MPHGLLPASSFSAAALHSSQLHRAAGLGRGNPPDQAALDGGTRLILPAAQKASPESPGDASAMLTATMSRLLCVLQHEPRAAQSGRFPVHRAWRQVRIHQRRPLHRKPGGWVLIQDLHSVYSPGWRVRGCHGDSGLFPSHTPGGAGDRGTWPLSQCCFRSRRAGARTPELYQHQRLSLTAPGPVFNDSYLELGAGMFMNVQCRDGLKSNVCLGLNDSNIESPEHWNQLEKR